ncbi:polysaccharide biosynthesis protein [Neptuniibacter sp. PT8_73]|uniref:polysaccharide biosynthesis protein n=1 Tax=unclassified Neptuniibacter TaxID=2630693 RepID=UPI0039F6DEDA
MNKIKTPASHHIRIMTLGRNYKKALMVIADLLVLPLSLWSAYALRLADIWPHDFLLEALPLFILTPLLGVAIFIKLGLYRAVVRFMGVQAIFSVVKGVIVLAVCMWLTAYLLDVKPFPRSVPIIFALVALVYVGGSRLLVRNYYHWLIRHYVEKAPVLIYGAGGSGVQLATALVGGADYLPVGFIDDDKGLKNTTVTGLPVFQLNELEEVISSYGISYVLLALPSISNSRRSQILESLSRYPVHVKTVPSMPEVVSGESVDNLRELDIEDLLGRDAVPPKPELLATSIQNKVVMVSGAGGSIGSEICRQIIQNSPKCLVLYEISEYALYSIERELRDLLPQLNSTMPIYAVLGSVLDKKRVQGVLKQFAVQTVYHAAAYKHVPIVEHNVIEGIRNNAFGTKVFAELAQKESVERFVLISTDKAVRPTNVMGASKRLAELVLQDMSRASSTIFSMVRFGNVLGSSGSVVPLFRKQIESGGPITVTHPEITRFFMTIPEAAALVMQAGSMAKGGDVFVLDMGKPVNISDLACRMIRLMGKEVCSPEFPAGIEVQYQGLRPGEKLYEELLIGEDVIGTEHPKIMRAEEESLSAEELQELFRRLEVCLSNGDCSAARELLEQGVKGYRPASPVVDWLDNVGDERAKHLM